MNPLFQQGIGSIIRWLLTFGAGWFITRGIWTEAEASTYIGGATVAILALLWSLWQKYRSRLKLVTAMATPSRTNERAVEALIADGGAPPASLAKDRTAYLSPPDKPAA